MNKEDRLNGWAEIAAYLGRAVRTVQRWEKEAALPIHRLSRHRRSPVHAYRKEIGLWIGKWEENPHNSSGALLPSSLPNGISISIGSRGTLIGWKEIAAFLGRGVRTVQRWEKQAGLPVRRLTSGIRPVPYAPRAELATWMEEQSSLLTPPVSDDNIPLRPPSLLQTLIDAFSAHIAILDAAGTIVAVNESWREFGQVNGYRDPNHGIGRNYLKVCLSASGRGAGEAVRVAQGVAEVLEGTRREFRLLYRCDSPAEKRRFLLRITRFEFRRAPLLILSHSNLTELLEQ